MSTKQFINEEDLLNDAFRLGVSIYNDGFRPTFVVGLWRGGSTVGIYVQECLQYLGVETDHIAVRTSYTGLPDYQQMVDNPADNIRVAKAGPNGKCNWIPFDFSPRFPRRESS